MTYEFLKNEPALIVKPEKMLVVSDTHIGREFRMEEEGMHFYGASRKMAERLLRLYEGSGAKGICIMGDVKESIGYPSVEGYRALKDFFYTLSGINIRIIKGNHDAHLDYVLHYIGLGIKPEDEILLKDTALLHGHKLPSKEALKKKYMILGHGHMATETNGTYQKIWMVVQSGIQAKLGTGAGRRIELVAMPAYNDIILGKVTRDSRQIIPILRNRTFRVAKARYYTLDGNETKI